MQVTKISATNRTDNGKGASRRLRAEGKLPAITYSKGAAARALVVSPDDVASILNSDHGINSLVELSVEGESVHAMIGDYQYHPLSRKLLHADFIEVKADDKVEVKVPLHLTGKAKGIVLGGKLRTVCRELPLRCVASVIPKEVTHDISDLGVDESLSAGELVVPEGVEVLLTEKQTVAIIAADKRAKTDEDEDAATPGAESGEAASEEK